MHDNDSDVFGLLSDSESLQHYSAIKVALALHYRFSGQCICAHHDETTPRAASIAVVL